MKIGEIDTWPNDLIEFLERNFEEFIGWECIGEYKSSPYKYNLLVQDLMNILKKYQITGYHCTKLLREEIEEIKKCGLKLQYKSSLIKRIDMIKSDSSNSNIIMRLKSENQSDDKNRKNMIWFCFFHPKIAGEHGIMRFFRSWGGEALYNSHERDNETGKFLKGIGIPCIIEAKVPMEIIPDIKLPYGQVTRVFLEEKGYKLENPYDYEGYIIQNLSSENIKNIHEYPSDEFIMLTDCKDWNYNFEQDF